MSEKQYVNGGFIIYGQEKKKMFGSYWPKISKKLMNAGICCIRMAAVIPSGVTGLT